MKRLLRYFLINLAALYFTTRIIPGLTYTGGLRSLVIGAFAFMLINMLLVPLLKIMLLPLNLLTLGLFAWVTNVLALFFLTNIVSDIKLLPYSFHGATVLGVYIPALDLTPFIVAIAASLLIGVITHFLQWMVH